MRAAIANKPDEKFPEGNAPMKELEVPVTPPDASVVKQIPKPPAPADQDAEPEGDAGQKAAPAPAPAGGPPQ